ncbi:branched-chain amino acid transferase [Variovorax paradoxus]|jgi:branched-chain amino acid aminotransferase|uniref:aminotransferase class IV n=1 Tax=Variovorax TaxID=34072 RepID=UPI0006E4C6ED|nr:aminotransferase class IV [Variovorax sp. CY25R-8]KPU98433.1 branched-chain amino acid transferase [Variovorax paradoxus]KPV11895.1 branched-chain amino acid transferase [Variovorax paradoxus]KPV13885.1 branched-chain amino acid transferase [Variovorax paradoxus]KPV25365.1 branched-chain amino acid transferase [Variovorax paradoxus]KPV35699.1 branched-chain amino acid transferase [Variovorax paradoxus]
MNPDFSAGVAHVDGQYVALRDARIPLVDRGFVRSDATYDVAHVWQGRFFRLDDHIDRFLWSMGELRMSLPLSKKEMRHILEQCVALSGLRDAYVQMTCTRGVPPPGSRDPRECQNRFYAFSQPFVWIGTPAQQRTGLAMVISQVQRIASAAIDTRVKNFHWLDLTMGIFEAYDRGALVAALPDAQGNVTEGAGFNIFGAKDGALFTPRRNVFEGMTRRTVIELARQLGIGCELADIPVQRLREADEIFITSTAGGVMPVTRLDGASVGNGEVGPLTQQLQRMYWQRAADDPRNTPVPYENVAAARGGKELA